MSTAAEFEKQGDESCKKNDFPKALEYYMSARKLNMNNALIYLKLGKVFFKLKNYKEAKRALELLQNTKPLIAEARILYAQAILLLGEVDRARELLDEIMQHPLPDYDRYVALQVYLILYSDSGENDKVIETAEKILQISPKNYSVLLRMIPFKKAEELDDAFLSGYESIADKIKGVDNLDDDLFFALAQAHDKRKNYKKAVKYAKRATAIHRRRHKFEIDYFKNLADGLKKTFTKDFFSSRKDFGDKDSKPIFIVGMPRSSTSLTEQILASHSKVTGCGELYTLGEFSVGHEIIKQDEQKFPESMQNVGKEQIEQLAKDYYADIESKGFKPIDGIITDKMPTNFFYIGLIALIFPNATIINCVRDLRDVAMSNYMHKFNTGHYWTQSLDDIHAMATLYRELMDHWNEVLPDKIYNLNYSNLLENTEEETRKLVAHCNLPWEDSCLEFHKTKRAVQTASMSQVKQPIFKSSLGKWKNYEPFFGKELKKLGELN